jgi:hypothetical protein
MYGMYEYKKKLRVNVGLPPIIPLTRGKITS